MLDLDMRNLPQQIARSFNFEELKQLCFRLEVDYESLGEGLTIENRALSLVEYMLRRQRESELLRMLKAERPRVSWPDPKSLQPSSNMRVAEEMRIESSKRKSSNAPKLNVFLCHCSEDSERARELFNALNADIFDPWIDAVNLLPGAEWRSEIPVAVRNADIVIVCLSNTSVSKKGYVQKEIKIALEVADEHPEGALYLIPVRLEPCQIPVKLQDLQYADLYDECGFERLRQSLVNRFIELNQRLLNQFEIHEIMHFLELVRHTQSRKGYVNASPISKLKDKLFRVRDSLNKYGFANESFGSLELALLLETIDENINYLIPYEYPPLPSATPEEQKAKTMAPINSLRRKTYLEFAEMDNIERSNERS